MLAQSLLHPGSARRGTGVCKASRHDRARMTRGLSRNSVNEGALQEETPLSFS